MSLPNCPNCGREKHFNSDMCVFFCATPGCGAPAVRKAAEQEQRQIWPEGRKDDHGKPHWGLLPFDAVGAIVRVLDFGAKKYAPRNWEQGMDWQRCFDALMRHLTAWWAREPADPETGFSHLWHAGACILFLIAYEMRGVGKDTRPNAAPHN